MSEGYVKEDPNLAYSEVSKKTYRDPVDIPTSSGYFVFNAGQALDIQSVSSDVIKNSTVRVEGNADSPDPADHYLYFARPSVEALVQASEENESALNRIIYNLIQQLDQVNFNYDLYRVTKHLDKGNQPNAEKLFNGALKKIEQLKFLTDATDNYIARILEKKLTPSTQLLTNLRRTLQKARELLQVTKNARIANAQELKEEVDEIILRYK